VNLLTKVAMSDILIGFDLLHGLVCSSCMSSTRQSTSGVDGWAPVWEL